MRTIITNITLLISLFVATDICANGKLNELGTKNVTSLESILQEHDFVIVDMYAEWCGPCKRMTPVLESFAADHSDIYIVKINVDNYHNISNRYGVQSIPTLLFFKKVNGQVQLAGKEMGSKSKKELEKYIKIYF